MGKYLKYILLGMALLFTSMAILSLNSLDLLGKIMVFISVILIDLGVYLHFTNQFVKYGKKISYINLIGVVLLVVASYIKNSNTEPVMILMLYSIAINIIEIFMIKFINLPKRNK